MSVFLTSQRSRELSFWYHVLTLLLPETPTPIVLSLSGWRHRATFQEQGLLQIMKLEDSRGEVRSKTQTSMRGEESSGGET